LIEDRIGSGMMLLNSSPYLILSHRRLIHKTEVFFNSFNDLGLQEAHWRVLVSGMGFTPTDSSLDSTY
jgi:hypothetical protein